MAHGVNKKKNELIFKDHFENFIDATEEESLRAEKRRDYRDLKQWTPEEAAKIEGRGQAAIVFDQYSKKVDGITGLEVNRRTDPKALPVHPKQEKASEVITDGLRFVESKTHLDETATEVFEDKIVEGYGGAIVEVEKVNGEFKILINRIPWDRIYYDPHSREKDYSDSSYFGITLWMDTNDAIALNPKMEDEIRGLVESAQTADDTFEDRPKEWVDTKRDRVRINQEYYLDKDVWHEVFFSGELVIIEAKVSPYLDEDGDPMNPIELQSDFIDRENNRWGYMQRLVDVQDEINHRRSKALYMLSTVSLIVQKGALGELSRTEALRELTKAQSLLELINPEGAIIDRNQEMGSAQLGFYQDAQNAMDSVGINPELTGSTESAISGRAFIARQQSGMTELARIMATHSNWKKRIYTQIWLRMKQFWTKEKWIRVSDNENAMRFVGLNVPITRAEAELEKQSGKTIEQLRDQFGEQLDAALAQSIQQNPQMADVVETRNDVKKLNMDIMIEEVPDTAILQQEQFDTLAGLASARVDPPMFEALLKLSSIPNKDDVLKMLRPDDEATSKQTQLQEIGVQLELEGKKAEVDNTKADTANTLAETQETLSKIPLNEAKAVDSRASAVGHIDKAARLN